MERTKGLNDSLAVFLVSIPYNCQRNKAKGERARGVYDSLAQQVLNRVFVHLQCIHKVLRVPPHPQRVALPCITMGGLQITCIPQITYLFFNFYEGP